MQLQDVYTEAGIQRTQGNDFPATEVLKVSQNSRDVWNKQEPFRLKRSKLADASEPA